MKIRLKDGRKVEAEVRTFTVLTDQSEKVGGDDTAPNPFELFLASLGTCSGYYVLAFCRKHDISTDGLELDMEFERDEATKLIRKVDIAVHFPPDFPQQYIAACIKSAEQCTVKKHLANPPEIVLHPSAA